MAAELITPTDSFSGLPYLIAPPEKLWLPTNNPSAANIHHAFHPRSSPAYMSTGGSALRNCWLELVVPSFHNFGTGIYHNFFVGPEPVTDPDEQFYRVVMACAGYIPDHVIDMSSGEPYVRRMSRAERRFFRTPGPSDALSYRYLRHNIDPIRRFLIEHTINTPVLQAVKERDVDEFMHTADEDRRLFLGHWLLSKQIGIATEQIVEPYSIAKKASLLHEAIPRRPVELIKYKLGATVARKNLVKRLHEHLALEVGIAA